MSERRLAIYPERPSEMAESYVRAIEVFHNPPEFELSPEEKEEVQTFERALCDGEFPRGFEFLAKRIKKPPKNIVEISNMNTDLKVFCIDWYIKTEKGLACLQSMGYEGNVKSEGEVREFLAAAIVRIKKNNLVNDNDDDDLDDGYESSRLWARAQLEQKLTDILEKGISDIDEPEYFSILRKPDELIERIAAARELKNYYKSIEAALRSSEDSNINDAKLVMLTMHRERINTFIATCYRQVIPLLNQYRLNQSLLSSEQIDVLTDAMPVLKNVDTTDVEKMARLYSMLDKFINGIDAENGFSQISAEIERLELALQDKPDEKRAVKNYDAKRFEDIELNAEQIKSLIQRILTSYGLLSSETKYSSKRKGRPEDGKWLVAISKIRTSLAVVSKSGVVWVPKKFKRSLDQKKPTGVLPLLDHEITHVLQHENASKLGIELLEKDRSARGSLWFETGATNQENLSFKSHFGIDRGTNFNYLKAMQTQLKGGSISECTKVFYDSLVSSGDITDRKQAIETAVDRTLRLFKHGGEWATKTGYLTNTEPLEYAEQQILARNLPSDLEWLYFVGRANFQTLAELYRIGWLKKDDIFVPEKMPSQIALEELAVLQFGG